MRTAISTFITSLVLCGPSYPQERAAETPLPVSKQLTKLPPLPLLSKSKTDPPAPPDPPPRRPRTNRRPSTAQAFRRRASHRRRGRAVGCFGFSAAPWGGIRELGGN